VESSIRGGKRKEIIGNDRREQSNLPVKTQNSSSRFCADEPILSNGKDGFFIKGQSQGKYSKHSFLLDDDIGIMQDKHGGMKRIFLNL